MKVTKGFKELVPGVLVVAALTSLAWGLAQSSILRRYGVSPLTLAIIFGALLGNTFPVVGRQRFRPGLAIAQRYLLRAGVALYGFNLSLQQIVQVGSTGILVDVVMVVSTLAMGVFIGRRLLGMDAETVLLTSAGSAICGAAAVVATVPLLRSEQSAAVAAKSAVAVATVVLFGSLSMLLYPILHTWLGHVPFDFGVYIGSTVHEVAQVVAIGSTLGETVVDSAVIVKMIRVMLLVPFLLIVGFYFGGGGAGGKRSVPIPWFAVLFVALAAVNSLHILPPAVVEALRLTAVLLLTTAMASLGIDTTFARMRQAGARPVLLGAGLFVHLVCFGGLVNWLAA